MQIQNSNEKKNGFESIKMLFRFSFFFLSVTIFLFSCQEKEGEVEVGKIPLARANKSVLYLNEVVDILPENPSKSDSIETLKRFAESWAGKQLLTELAISKIKKPKEEIERKVLDYRYSLLLHEYQKQFVEESIDTVITNEQIADYYNLNKQDFELKQNIVKAIYVQLPNNAPKTERVKQIMVNRSMVDFEELKSYCYRYAQNYYLSYNEWIDIEKLAKGNPIAEVANKPEFLKRNQFYEVKDDNNVYFLSILDVKVSSQISPVEYVKETIKALIYNERKLELIRKFEQEVINKAKNNQDIEIYIK